MRYECRTAHEQVQTHSGRLPASSLKCSKDTWCDEQSRCQKSYNLKTRAQEKNQVLGVPAWDKHCLSLLGKPVRPLAMDISLASSFACMMMQHLRLQRGRYSDYRDQKKKKKWHSKFTPLTRSVQLSLNVAEGPTSPLGSRPAEQVAAVVHGGQDQAQHGDVAEWSTHSFLGVWARKENVCSLSDCFFLE